MLAPGESLGGARLGMTRGEIRAAWGDRHGVCRRCGRKTWYFNERPFAPQGAGVSFERGRAVRLFTVWQPQGWRTVEGLALGEEAARVEDLYGPLARHRCRRYTAFLLPGANADTVFYVYRGAVWAFGLERRGVRACL